MPFQLSATERVDAVNIGLMLVSLAIAFVIPLELFLFSYAVLGPLHYLTEISWLHDKKYYTKGRYDAVVLLVIGLLTTVSFLSIIGKLELEFPSNFNFWIGYIGLLSAAVFALIKSPYIRIVGIVLIVLSAQVGEHFALFLTIFLPTLIHVYVFTGLFMLYGALKSKSRLGILSVVLLALCPIILFTVAPNFLPFGYTRYGQEVYYGNNGAGLISTHIATLSELFHVKPANGTNNGYFWLDQVFKTQTGLLVLRFIAFAYTYHYFNWFSKTRVIQWHKVPKQRFAVVVVFWLVSVGLYIYSYMTALIWLFFLSYMHVLLELPLNFTSIWGIGRHFGQKMFPAMAKAK